ncbi:MAG: sensor histidine kinase [Saezia sp.]
MPNHSIYTYMSKPASILRILVTVCIIAMLAGAWGATDLLSWVKGSFPFFTWALFATLCWLTFISFTNIILRISPTLFTWINARHQLKLIIYHFLPVIIGSICAGTMASPIFTLASGQENMYLRVMQYWSWPAALWGGFIALCITEWFHIYTQSQDPANNLAKLMELQARIRPHFLFNTLNSAIALVRLDPDAAESVLQNLAMLFRAALRSGENSIATVEDEIELAKSYLLIESIRLGERLTVTWHINEHYLPMSIPQLSLQPLIENAIRHGIEPTSKRGEVIISASSRLGKIIFTISNTMPPPSEELHEKTKGHGMALKNLQERIALLYDFEGTLKTKITQDKNGQYWFKAIMEAPAITA